MTKFQICFVDDQDALLPDFIGWSYDKKKVIIDNYIRKNDRGLNNEINSKLGFIFDELDFQTINENINLDQPKPFMTKIKELHDILFEYDNFEVRFVRELSVDIDSNSLLILDVAGVISDYNDLPNVPFIIFTGGQGEIDSEIKSHRHFITSYKKDRNNFKLLMEGVEKCAKSNQIEIKYFSEVSIASQGTQILYSLLPLDIDMQGLEILWTKNKVKALSYFNEMYIYWTNEILIKKWAKARELIDQIPDESEKQELLNFTIGDFFTLLSTINDGKWDGNNHFRNWFSKINSLITKM